ncbi:GNAT family N-acetyltransferase [Marinicella sediminis]|uniref:GNAT family N-acetyltransferase n=1 Tax=Marinicella sediminis TaxID=1792834 RepID=A0ABV7JBN7_9GAMM|nr:GNAT family N-acetyltransferase [Marinicella sediminis]
MSDTGLMAGLYQHELMMQHIGPPLSLRQATQLAQKLIQQSQCRQALVRLLFHQTEEAFAGLISLHWRDSLQAVEFGIMIRPEYQKHGLSRSALLPLMRQSGEFFTQPVQLLCCFIDKHNVSANEGCRKLGFQRVANLSNSARHHNKNRWNVTMEQLNQ